MSERYGIVYMGSKEKILNLIDYIFEREYKKKYFIDMFTGGFSVAGYTLAKTHFNVIANDLNKYVISLYEEILNGGKDLKTQNINGLQEITLTMYEIIRRIFRIGMLAMF